VRPAPAGCAARDDLAVRDVIHGVGNLDLVAGVAAEQVALLVIEVSDDLVALTGDVLAGARLAASSPAAIVRVRSSTTLRTAAAMTQTSQTSQTCIVSRPGWAALCRRSEASAAARSLFPPGVASTS
jgi:hypothetical protein